MDLSLIQMSQHSKVVVQQLSEAIIIIMRMNCCEKEALKCLSLGHLKRRYYDYANAARWLLQLV